MPHNPQLRGSVLCVEPVWLGTTYLPVSTATDVSKLKSGSLRCNLLFLHARCLNRWLMKPDSSLVATAFRKTRCGRTTQKLKQWPVESYWLRAAQERLSSSWERVFWLRMMNISSSQRYRPNQNGYFFTYYTTVFSMCKIVSITVHLMLDVFNPFCQIQHAGARKFSTHVWLDSI